MGGLAPASVDVGAYTISSGSARSSSTSPQFIAPSRPSRCSSITLRRSSRCARMSLSHSERVVWPISYRDVLRCDALSYDAIALAARPSPLSRLALQSRRIGPRLCVWHEGEMSLGKVKPVTDGGFTGRPRLERDGQSAMGRTVALSAAEVG